MHHIKRVAAATTEHDFEQSMYGVMGDHYGVVLRRAQQQIKAINLDERIAGLLGVDEGAATLPVKRNTVDEQGRIVERGPSICRGDLYDFSQSSRVNPESKQDDEPILDIKKTARRTPDNDRVRGA